MFANVADTHRQCAPRWPADGRQSEMRMFVVVLFYWDANFCWI